MRKEGNKLLNRIKTESDRSVLILHKYSVTVYSSNFLLLSFCRPYNFLQEKFEDTKWVKIDQQNTMLKT